MQILNKEQKILFWLVLLAAIVSALFETLGVSAILPVVNALLTRKYFLTMCGFNHLSNFFQ